MPNVERVQRNEEYLDEAAAAVTALLSALRGYAAAKPKIAALTDYYYADWRADVYDDDAGLLPPGLKRGVLSQDAIFNLLTEDAAVRQMAAELFSADTSSLRSGDAAGILSDPRRNNQKAE